MFFLGGSPLVCFRGIFLSLLLLWLVSVVFWFCRCCVPCVFGRLVVGRACPCPPLLVGLLLCLVLLFVLVFFVFLVLSCGCPPLWPPHPWRLVVLISGSEGFPSVVSVWISGCFGNGLGVWPVCLTSCLLLTGLEMEICLLPCVFVLYGNKGFGPVWGTALYTMLCLASCGLWLPPLSRLHVAPRHHSLRRSAACVPLLGALC